MNRRIGRYATSRNTWIALITWHGCFESRLFGAVFRNICASGSQHRVETSVSCQPSLDTALWPRPYSGLTGQVPLRTGLTMLYQRSWMHVLSVISRCCVWEINIWVLPALLQMLKGRGVSLSVLRPYVAHCIILVCMPVVPEESLS